MANTISELSNLQQRVLVALVGIGLFLSLLYLGWQGALVLFSAILLLSLYEFYSLSPFPFPKGWKWAGVLSGYLLFLWIVFSIALPQLNLVRFFFILPPLLFIAIVFSGLKKPFEMAGWMVLGWFYLVTPWVSFILIFLEMDYRPEWILGLFGLLWMADSGAYFAGKNFGKTKLLPRVSPKKSWEGLGGGLVGSILLAWILGTYAGGFSLPQWIILAVSTTIFGTLGDLAESALKRSLDIKDSGTILPGHGGILDRFDGLFVAAPVNLLIVTFLFPFYG